MTDLLLNGSSRMEAMNGPASRVAPMNGMSSRMSVQTMNGTINMADPKPYDMPLEDYVQYLVALKMDDPAATMNGLRKWLKRVSAGAKRKRKARHERQAQRRELRMERKQARTERLKRGETFFDKAGSFLRDIGQSKNKMADVEGILAQQGLQAPDGMIEGAIFANAQELIQDTGTGAEQSRFMAWFEENKALAIGGGITLAVLLGLGIYLLARPKKKRRRR